MPRPEGIDEKVKEIQIARLLLAGFSPKEAKDIWIRFRSQYLTSWKEYVQEELIEKPRIRRSTKNESTAKPRKESRITGGAKEDHGDGEGGGSTTPCDSSISGILPNPSDPSYGGSVSDPARVASAGETGTPQEEKPAPGSLGGTTG